MKQIKGDYSKMTKIYINMLRNVFWPMLAKRLSFEDRDFRAVDIH